MAVRHIKEYFNQVADQYLLMKSDVEDFEREAAEGLCDPERIESLKQAIEPYLSLDL